MVADREAMVEHGVDPVVLLVVSGDHLLEVILVFSLEIGSKYMRTLSSFLQPCQT